ncbi:RNA-dependent RNA polymerase [Erysiphe necator associated ourmia-like virus 44]|nr:RNA-dependent RNA polymerase [Erysiphe necator associated ourmia-like virus 44]
MDLHKNAFQRSSSRVAHVTRPVDNPTSGSTVKRCFDCFRGSRVTKETIHNGLLLLRVRYGFPYSELPDCGSGDLSRFLSFLLLQGKERTSVAFPRRQRHGENGLCSLQRLCRRDRWALAHGCSSIKRNLPKSCRRHTPSARPQWEKTACSQPSPPSPDYIAHVRRVVAGIFRPGWDRSYHSFVGNHVPNPSARASKERADAIWAGRRDEFFTATTAEGGLVPPALTGRYKDILSAGKTRPMLIFDESVELLAPLHKLLYSHLAKQDWLLCGPPTEERMASVLVNARQTSVDLVAATDGLNLLVSQTILDGLFFTSVKIPRTLRAFAKSSLHPFFGDLRGGVSRVSHGQMMGAYLSFPLLCIHSYCAASWAARDQVGARFLVNGDDTVISAGRDISVQDYPSGYRLNADKTIRAGNVAELNSTVFLKSGRKWREIRHLRRGGAIADFPGMMHMAKAVCITPGFVDAFQRCRIGRRWGFLPSQLGHTTYPSYKRERGLRVRRYWTPLPEPSDDVVFPEELNRITGRDPTPVEAEALRVVMWRHGRWGGSKRDVFSPSCGKVRRSYRYRAQPCKSYLSFVGSGRPKLSPLCEKGGDLSLVPTEFVSDEESRGLEDLEQFRRNWDRGFILLQNGALDF